MRMAIVDDEISIRFSLKKFFELRSFTVDTAASTAEARKLLSDGIYDVVILDIRLVPDTEVDGLDLVGCVRAHSPGARIIVLSGYLSPQTIRRARSLRADLILSKPQPLNELETAIRAIL
ncbi:MAG TPA: response regulator [Thermoanaerobaculia bacterium]|nr:response regulator [Thermoanaerobaculia bacterium]